MSSVCSRTGLFPTVVEKDDKKATPCAKRRSDVLKEKQSLQKASETKSCPPSSRKISNSARKVKTVSDEEEQRSLREKLNQWLIAKGKTPRKCENLIKFNAQVSAKKKSRQPDSKVADKIVSQNSLLNQVSENNKTVDGQPSAAKKRKSVEKENQRATRRSIRFADEVTLIDDGENAEDTTENNMSGSNNMLDTIEVEEPIGHGDPLEHLNSLLQECLALYETGCPLESLLPWLRDIENHVPQARTCALFYITKAKVLSTFPQVVLDLYCQAVRNNAQPTDLLAKEMQASLSLLLVPSASISPPEGVLSSTPAYSQDTRYCFPTTLETQEPTLKYTNAAEKQGRSSAVARQDLSYTEPADGNSRFNNYGGYNNTSYERQNVSCPIEDRSGYISEASDSFVSDNEGTRLVDSYNNVYGESESMNYLTDCDTTRDLTCTPDGSITVSLRYNTPEVSFPKRRQLTPYSGRPSSICGSGSRLRIDNTSASSPSCTPSFHDGSTYLDVEGNLSGQSSSTPLDGAHSAPVYTMLSTKKGTGPYTPLSQRNDGATLGSKINYKVGCSTPNKLSHGLVDAAKEASPVAVVTPVRRSIRLSGRPLTPASNLREIDSMSDLSEYERRHMVFQDNPAIDGQ